jgi:8-oxo-dGTP diphosphatase
MKDVTAAIIIENKKVLVAQRADHGKMALKWELPGGKIEPGETPQQCLKREIKEELDIEVEVLGLFGESMYCYDFGDIRLLAYFCRRLGGNITLMCIKILSGYHQNVWGSLTLHRLIFRLLKNSKLIYKLISLNMIQYKCF